MPKRLLYPILLTLLVSLFSGCETAGQKAQLMGREQQKIDYANTILKKRTEPDEKELKRMELESKREIAKIQMQKAIEVERLKAEAKKTEVLSQKEIELKKAELKKSEIESQKSYNGWLIALIAAIFSVSVLLLYKLFREHQRIKLQLNREKMAHEASLKEKELQAKIVEKMIDAVGSGKLTPEQHEKLIESMGKKAIPYR